MTSKLRTLLSKNILCVNSAAVGAAEAEGEGAQGTLAQEVRRRRARSQALTVDPRTDLAIIQPPAFLTKGKFPEVERLEGGIIHYFDIVNKITHTNTEQPRIMVISHSNIYFCNAKNGSVRRCTPIHTIENLYWDDVNNFIGLKAKDGLDILFKADKPVAVIQPIRACYAFLTGKTLEPQRCDLKDEAKNGLRLQLKTNESAHTPRCLPIPALEDIFLWQIERERLAERDQKIKSLSEALEQLKTQQDGESRDRSEKDNVITSLRQQLLELGQQLQESQNDMDLLRAQNNTAEERLLIAESQLSAQDASKQEHILEKTELQSEISQLKESQNVLQTANAKLKEEFVASRQRENLLTQDLAELRVQAVQMQKEMERIQAREAALAEYDGEREGLELLRSKLDRLENNNAALLDDVSRWQEANERLVSLNNDLIRERGAAVADADTLRRHLVQVEHSESEWRYKLEEETRHWGRRIAELETQCAERDNLLRQFELTNDEYRCEISKLEEELRRRPLEPVDQQTSKQRIVELERSLQEAQFALLETLWQQKVCTQVGGGYMRYEDFLKKYGKLEAEKMKAAVIREKTKRMQSMKNEDLESFDKDFFHITSSRSQTRRSPSPTSSKRGGGTPVVFRDSQSKLTFLPDRY